MDQLVNVAAVLKALGQDGVSLPNSLFKGRDRAALDSQFGLKLAGIEKRVIHHSFPRLGSEAGQQSGSLGQAACQRKLSSVRRVSTS